MWYKMIATVIFVALLSGCMTLEERISKRIEARADFFATLPVESQERLRKGQLQIGDSEDAAWIVHGPPSRISTRQTQGCTNVIWSYVLTEAQPIDELRPVAYPVASPHGRVMWTTDYHYYRSYVYEAREYLRIEFNNKKVIAIDTTH
jgi:hypothetical protein